ncbi:homoserine dehydrogenase [Pseudoxanthomonas mexicana]|uniref:homoserine dehydrogenase n=1 Tax=Pseudoxanthomonas mexicana TaxID=128785 RepID=UPI00398AAE56
MSAVVPLAGARRHKPRLALLGTGGVGSAFVDRYRRLLAKGLPLPEFGWLANSRALHDCGEDAERALQRARRSSPRRDALPPWAENESLRAGDLIVDATASEIVADWHAEWLARGVHVVTANKLGNGASELRAQAIAQAIRHSGARYGDAATVGAGLPLLRSLRALVAGGDRIHRIEGVLSGSLAWLFNQYDGALPFSHWVRQAQAAGYTEPDPRIDLSGEDVRRKLLILARASGLMLRGEDVQVQSLVPVDLAALPLEEVDAALERLDEPLYAHWRAARDAGARLRFVGRFDGYGDSAEVGLQALDADHPLCGGAGTDNRVAIFSDRYATRPLLIQGPGAGTEVTAAALLDDVLAIAAG